MTGESGLCDFALAVVPFLIPNGIIDGTKLRIDQSGRNVIAKPMRNLSDFQMLTPATIRERVCAP